VINRLHPMQSVELEEPEIALKVEAAAGLPPEQASKLAGVLARSHAQLQSLAGADAVQVQRLREQCGDTPLYLPVPLFNEDIYDMLGLLMLGRFLGVRA
jgi:hypothetical protein